MTIISDILENISQTNSTINESLSFDNQSLVVFQIGINYDNSLQNSPQLQYQKQSKIADNQSDSLPLPWIAAIIINAILVFLFILFVIYCYWKSKKRRQRIRNPDKESLFSGKSRHSVKEVQKDVNATKDNNIFNIESEHKRLTESYESADNVTESNGRKTSMKSPITKVQSVNRLSSGARGSIHDTNYNPTDSPSVSKFTDQLNDSVPNQPQYKAKHEEQDFDNQMLETVEEMDEETSEYKSRKGDNKSKHSSPSKSRRSSPTKQMPHSSPSITTATNIMSKMKGLGHSSSPKSVTPERQVSAPGSPQSSHSTAVQTSPNTSWANIPGAVIDENDRYYDERGVRLRDDTQRKYFLYIIKDVNPFTKKECIGRITLPTSGRMTLEQLRYHLLQSDDETIRNCAKRKFKFLSESYRLVVMNESFTPVDQIYQTQGIFIKFNAGSESVPFGYRSKNKIRAANRFAAIENGDNYSTDRLQTNTISRANTRLSEKTDSVYASTPRNIPRKSSIYGTYSSTYGSTPRNGPKTPSNYDSTPKTVVKSRFGFDRNSSKQTEDRSYAMERTPRRDVRENMTASHLYLTTTPSVSPLVSPRTRVRLCRKLEIQSQVQSGQLEEMPNFFTSTSLDSGCDNPGCYNKPLLKCYVCSKVNYCSHQCKRDHWTDHRFICKKPPWKG